MSKTAHFLLLPVVLLAANGCADNLATVQDSLFETGVMAGTTGYEADCDTKVSFTDNLSNFLWSNGDCIGICRSGSTANGTAAFTLLQGGASTGNFINDSFSLNADTDYFAFYPYNGNATSSSYLIDLAGQVQNANNATDQVGKYNYMRASFKTDADKKASFTFSNLCSVIQVHFTADGSDTYRSMQISSDNKYFGQRATYNLSTGSGLITQMLDTVSLSFGDGMTVKNGEEVTATMVVYPVDQSESKLTFSILGKDGIVKSFTLSGFAMTAGKLYQFREDDSAGNPAYGSCPDGNHHHTIDLGLPSGVLWACCNLGADYPWELGISFAWGETAMVEKTNSNWENYIFMTDTYTDWNGISKYQIPDKKYAGVWYAADSTFIGDNINTLLPEDDAARVNWGGTWRLPTKKEADELLNYTQIQVTSNYNNTGKSGLIFYKKKVNGKYALKDTHIFIPFTVENYLALYLTSTLSSTTDFCPLYYKNIYMIGSSNSRVSKHPIRPVCSGVQ